MTCPPRRPASLSEVFAMTAACLRPACVVLGLLAAAPGARAADKPVEFTRQVEPILTKAGCNSGACHGAQHGRGGFRLSLFGFDPAFDYAQIIQSAEGRRTVLSDPERSILLLKPSLQMDHGGGERLRAGSPEYEVLRRWLED